MAKDFDIKELSIVVIGTNHNPTILNPDFLKSNDIVPACWQLAKAPICAEPVAEVAFENGLRIVAQLDKIVFSEAKGDKDPWETLVPRVAKKYLEQLPHVEYQAVGINPQGDFPFGDDSEGPRNYIVGKILAKGRWLDFGKAPVRAAVRFMYKLEQCQCTLSVQEAKTQGPQDLQKQVLLFSANFHRDLIGDTKDQRFRHLLQTIEQWQNDIKIYEDLISNSFLAEEV